jgi:hypothetical protein
VAIAPTGKNLDIRVSPAVLDAKRKNDEQFTLGLHTKGRRDSARAEASLAHSRSENHPQSIRAKSPRTTLSTVVAK